MSFITEHLETLQQFADMSKQVGDRADYVQGGGGNTSVKTADGKMAIKASGFRLSDITPENAYALIDYLPLAAFYNDTDPATLADVEKTGSEKAKELTLTIPELPALRPSVEAGFHSILDRFVVHSHSVYANLAACAAECEEILSKAFKDAPYSYAVVPYTDPGAKLTFIIRDAIRKVEAETGKKPAVVVMKNHGLIATAGEAREAEGARAPARGGRQNGRRAGKGGQEDRDRVDGVAAGEGEGGMDRVERRQDAARARNRGREEGVGGAWGESDE